MNSESKTSKLKMKNKDTSKETILQCFFFICFIFLVF